MFHWWGNEKGLWGLSLPLCMLKSALSTRTIQHGEIAIKKSFVILSIMTSEKCCELHIVSVTMLGFIFVIVL